MRRRDDREKWIGNMNTEVYVCVCVCTHAAARSGEVCVSVERADSNDIVFINVL